MKKFFISETEKKRSIKKSWILSILESSCSSNYSPFMSVWRLIAGAGKFVYFILKEYIGEIMVNSNNFETQFYSHVYQVSQLPKFSCFRL